MLTCNNGPKVRIKGEHFPKLACKDRPMIKDSGVYLVLSCLVDKPKVYFSSNLTKNEPKKSYGEHVIPTKKEIGEGDNPYKS